MSRCTVTFVLVTYGHGELAARCLDVLARHTGEPYEVVVVDSASPDGAGEWLERNLAGVTVLRMPHNLGFGAGCELGVRRARGEFVCFLNADVEVTAGWLEPLLELLRYNDKAAAVAPVMTFPDGRLQEAGSMIGGDGFSRGWGDGEQCTDELYPRVVDYASAACLLVRRRAFYAAGGFCPDYHIAYYEDADLQFELRRRGWQVWLQPESKVVHVRHGTSSTRTAERLSEINRKTFRERWAAELAMRAPAVHAPRYPHRLHWLRDMAAPFSVLLLMHRVPADGRELAAVRAWRAADPAAVVTVLAAGGTGAASLRADGVEVVSDVDDAAAWGLDRAGCYDVVVTFGVAAHGELGAAADDQPQAVRVFDFDGLAHVDYEHRFATARDTTRRRELGALAGRARRDAVRALRDADVVVCAQHPEADWAGEINADVPIHLTAGQPYEVTLDKVLVDCGLPPRPTGHG
ncbi:MAG: glycosyltransferase [Pseudonocardiaceae bacterium]|nr:glycosyltransferase [Pseudonocardiaceae bacterium]